MAKVDEFAQGFVQLRFGCAELEGPSALQTPVPVICFPTEYPHRRLHQKPCCCQGNQHLPRRSLGFRTQIDGVQFAHSTSSYLSWPWEWIPGGFAPSIPAHRLQLAARCCCPLFQVQALQSEFVVKVNTWKVSADNLGFLLTWLLTGFHCLL